MTDSLSGRLLVWSSLSILAWFIGGLLAPPPEPVAVEIHARPDLRHPDAKGSQVALLWATVDGARVAPDTAVATGDWVQETWGFRTRDGAGSLRFQGRQVTIALLRSPWSSAVQVIGDGEDALHDLFAPQDADPLVLERGHGVRWLPWSLLALVVLILVAAAVRPWRSEAGLQGHLIVYMTIVHALVWCSFPVGSNNDSSGYLDVGGLLLRGEPGYFPPGYPSFLAACSAMAPGTPAALATALQHAAMVIALVCLHGLACAFLPRRVAQVALLVLGSCPATLCLPQALLSEAVAVPATTFALWSAWRAWQSPGAGTLLFELLAGTAAALATLARVTPLPVLLPAWLVLAWGADGARVAATRLARTVGVALVVVGATTSWFGVRSGHWGLTTSAGLHLFNRVVDEQELIAENQPAGARYLAAMRDHHSPFVPHWEARAVLERSGMSWSEATGLLGATAWEGLLASPVAYARHTVAMAAALHAADPMPQLPHGPGDPKAAAWERPALWPDAAAAAVGLRRTLDATFAAGWWMLVLLPLVGAIGLACGAGRGERAAVLVCGAGSLLTTSALEHFVPRYALASLPFLLVVWPAWRSRSGGALAEPARPRLDPAMHDDPTKVLPRPEAGRR